MPRLAEDQALREAFRNGDKAALAEVYRDYAPEILDLLERGFRFESSGRTLVFRGYVDPWQAEATLADIFIKAFAEPARLAYDGKRPYRNYLFVIARNVIIDELRRRGPKVISLDETQHAPAPDDTLAASPHDSAELCDLIAAADTFVASLPPAEHDLFVLRFYRGLSVEECARTLPASEHFVKRSERRLRKRFFHHMRSRGYFEGYSYGSAGLTRAMALLAALVSGIRS